MTIQVRIRSINFCNTTGDTEIFNWLA